MKPLLIIILTTLVILSLVFLLNVASYIGGKDQTNKNNSNAKYDQR